MRVNALARPQRLRVHQGEQDLLSKIEPVDVFLYA
jgi:hypothetical protein